MRRFAIKNMRELGLSLVGATRASRKDNELRTQFFITPLALSARPASSRGNQLGSRIQDNQSVETGLERAPRASNSRVRTVSKGEGTGTKRDIGGNPKGTTTSTARSDFRKALKAEYCRIATPDGKKICFAFNDQGCTRDACSFAHVCAGCFGAHKWGPQCPRYNKF